MAYLQRVRILPNERLDLPDFKNLSEFICSDFQAIKKYIYSDGNYVFQGFEATGTGTSELSVALGGSAAILGENGGQWFIGSPILDDLATTSLTPNATNYVEVTISSDTGAADNRAFWDQTANSNEGAEFSQIVDTFTFLKAELSVNTSSFSGESSKLKICEVDVNGAGVITEIRDARDFFYRLGRSTDAEYSFPWISRTEPASNSFTGGDKDIKDIKDFFDAVMDSIKEIKGTTYWFEEPSVSLNDGFRNAALSLLTAQTASAKISWDGSSVFITDNSGAPTNADVIANLRLFDSVTDLNLTRQDNGDELALADGEVLWIEIPKPLANTSYSDSGFVSTNYRINTRGSVPNEDTTFWLAFREGTKLYVRGLGELEAGEERQISDETTGALSQFLGFDPEIATSVPYTTLPSVILPNTFTTSDSLVEAISTNTANINSLASTLDANVYDELMTVVSGAPASDNEITGPVAIDTIITLPLDSRDGNSSETYVVGAGVLEIYLNGTYLFLGKDWEEIGTPGNLSTQIRIKTQLEIGDDLVFRIDTTGGFQVIAGGGTSSLQDAYNIGSSIVVSSGNPVTIQGPIGEKLFRVLGDVEITGVIDPKGMEFTREVTNPLAAGADGIWFNSNGDMIQQRNGLSAVNITQQADSLGQFTLENNTGGTITALTPVASDSNGDMVEIDISNESEAYATLGVLVEETLDTESGKIMNNGIIKDVSLAFNMGLPLYVSKAGGITDVKPTIGQGGFVSGDFSIRLGILVKNQDNPANKDFIVNVIIEGQL